MCETQPNNNTIDMENDKDKFIREYVVFDPNTLHKSIVRPNITIAQFEFKPIMFKMLQSVGQFSGAITDDLHLQMNGS